MKIRISTIVLSQLSLACAKQYHPHLVLPTNLRAPCEIAKVLFKNQFPCATKRSIRECKNKCSGTFFWQGVLLNYIQNAGKITLPISPIRVASPYPEVEIPDVVFTYVGRLPALKPGKSAERLKNFQKAPLVKAPQSNTQVATKKTNQAVAIKIRQEGYSRQNARNLYASDEWRRLRYDVLREQDGRCQLCGRGRKDGVILHVDHIVPLSKDWSKRLDKNNLQVLCEDCNLGKSNTDQIDWR